MSQKEKKQETLIKKTTLTIQQRLDVLQKLKSGQSIQDLADQYFVHRSTISRVKKSEKEILENDSLLKSCDGNPQKKRFKGVETSQAEQSLYKWFQECREMQLPITGPALRKKALFFHQKFHGNTEFKASEGWLRRFKQRHGIKSISIHGKKSSANIAASEDFKTKFLTFIESSGFTLDQINNCDEAALCLKMMSNRTPARINEKKTSGRKKDKSEMTIKIENCTPELSLQNTNEFDYNNSALLNDQTIDDDEIPKVSVAEAYKAVNTLKNFYQHNKDEEASYFLPVLQGCYRHILHKFCNHKN